MMVGNHSGGVAIDAAMVIASLFWEMEPPRLAQGMAEKFISQIPFFSSFLDRCGQLTGLPEHAIHLLEQDRVLMVFPEGARGTAKLYKERYSLVHFGSGFVRLAMQTKAPIIPFAFVGGGEVMPTVWNLYSLGKLVGVPYIPLTSYLLPFPLPVSCQIHYGEAMFFEGDGSEADEVIEANVRKVKEKIAELLEKGRQMREDVSLIS